MRTGRAVLAAALAALLAPALRAEDGPKRPWNWDVSGGASFFRGNTDRQSFEGATNFEWTTEKREFTLRAEELYAETAQAKDANKGELTATYDQKVIGRESVFLFAMPSYNQFQLIDFRMQSGAGWKHSFVKSDKVSASFSAAFLDDSTDYKDPQENVHINRYSFRPKLKYAISEKNTMSVVYFFQPRANKWDDYRTQLDASIDFQLIKNLFFQVQFTHEYNRVVPDGVKRRDVTLLNALKFKI